MITDTEIKQKGIKALKLPSLAMFRLSASYLL